MKYYQQRMFSPVGELKSCITEEGCIRAVLWPDHPEELVPFRDKNIEIVNELECFPSSVRDVFVRLSKQISEYFDGVRKDFDLPLDLKGTEFQVQVWQSLLEIQYGQTGTYGEQAASIGRPQAARAVGAAIGRNPVSILIPCHRVVGASGALTGFAGGLERKSFLLEHEKSSL